jgi:hypothetical protein
MIQALVLAVRCALKVLSKSDLTVLPLHGASPSGTYGIVNNSVGMVWKDLVPSSNKFLFDYKNIPDLTYQS